jgi:hypothetical protein
LAKRLSRYGLTGSAGGLGVALFQAAVSASVPTVLLASTVQIVLLQATGHAATAGVVTSEVVALSKCVLNAMFWTKVKTATVVLLGLGALGGSAGRLAYEFQAAKPAGTQKEAGAHAPAPDAPQPKDAKEPKEGAARQPIERAGTGFAVASGSVQVGTPERKPMPATVRIDHKGSNLARLKGRLPPVTLPSLRGDPQALADHGTAVATLGTSLGLAREPFGGILDQLDALSRGRDPMQAPLLFSGDQDSAGRSESDVNGMAQPAVADAARHVDQALPPSQSNTLVIPSDVPGLTPEAFGTTATALALDEPSSFAYLSTDAIVAGIGPSVHADDVLLGTDDGSLGIVAQNARDIGLNSAADIDSSLPGDTGTRGALDPGTDQSLAPLSPSAPGVRDDTDSTADGPSTDVHDSEGDASGPPGPDRSRSSRNNGSGRTSANPEPSSLVLMAIGIVGLGVVAWKRRCV